MATQHCDDYHRELFAAAAPRGRHEAVEVEADGEDRTADLAPGGDGERVEAKVITPPAQQTILSATQGVDTK